MTSYTISILVPGMPFQGDTLEHKSLGGSETAGLYMARELAALGHRVHMFTSGCVAGDYDGVTYRDLSEWQAFVTSNPHDVAIVQRKPEVFTVQFTSKLNILWCHDLALSRFQDQIGGVMWNLDKVLLLSEFMQEQYRAAYGVQPSETFVTRNGIDLDRFNWDDVVPRDRKRLIYAARPERGMDVLLKDIFPRILEREPDAVLALCGYDNPVEHMQPFYAEMAEITKGFGNKCVWLGHLTKDQLYREYANAGVYVYPTPSAILPEFREISCITAMECQASGLPIVTSRLGALPETIRNGAGVLINGEPSETYINDFVEATIRLMNDDDAWNRASAAGKENAKSLSWTGAAELWSEMLDREICERNSDGFRLAKHFYRHSEVTGAKSALQWADGAPGEKLAAEIDENYGFLDSPEAFAAHYLEGGKDTLSWLEPRTFTRENLEASNERRFHVLRENLASSPAQKVVEYGCGHGWSTVYLHNHTGKAWLGIDIDPQAIEYAETRNRQFLANPDIVEFKTGDHTLDIQPVYDAVICSEVLEHVIDPNEVLEAIEKWVIPGGQVMITVPYGPVEYGTYNWDKFRNHVREFGLDDLRDMFKDKPGVRIETVPEGIHKLTTEAMGFYLVIYTADQKPLGKIDWQRKLNVQRPRQTLSVNIIAGPGVENTIRWCLESVQHVADEIVIADTGMSKAALDIAGEFGCIVVPGSSPIQHGFETPRNEALAASSMDWILWIDTDEKLLNQEAVPKYLRENCYHGYSIRQHHFAVDTIFDPDMPVRLFRRRARDHKTMRFYGMIHEHPELSLNEGPGPVCVIGEVSIAHLGYLNETGRRERFKRNYPLLQRDIEVYPDRILQKHFICRDNLLMANFEREQNGGRLTDSVRQRCEQTIELYREHFLGKPKMLNINTLQYYSEANRILNQGFETSLSMAVNTYGVPNFDVQINKDGVGDHIQGPSIRFANKQDFEAELTNMAKDKANRFTNPWW